MGASAGGQRLPSGGMAGQGGGTAVAQPMRSVGTPVGQNPYQQAAGAQAQALSTAGQLAGYQAPSAAMDTTRNIMGYQPQQVQATSYDASTMSRPDQAATQMGAYTNPYESQVVQQTLRDIGGQAQMGQQNLAAQAQAAKAFGGSRHGVAEAEAMKGYTQQMADAASRMRQQGFNTALGAAQFDVGQQQAAAAANQAALNQAAQFGAQTGMTAQQLNQSAGLQGAQLRLGAANQLGNMDLSAARMRQGAAGQLGGLGQQSFGYGQSIQNQQAQQGALQRGIQQQLIDAGQASFDRYTGAPAQGLNTLIGALTGAGVPSGQTTSSRPGLFNYLQVLAGM